MILCCDLDHEYRLTEAVFIKIVSKDPDFRSLLYIAASIFGNKLC